MIKFTGVVCGSTLFIVVAFTGAAYAQGQTVPEMLVQAGTALGYSEQTPSGAPERLDTVIADAEVILRGVIGESRSYLSEDERRVLTDYSVEQTMRLYRGDGASPNTSPQVRLTVPGGSVTIDGLMFSATYLAYPRFERGMDVLLLLKRAGGGHVLARYYYGAFAIKDDRLVPLTGKDGFAAELTDVAAAKAITDIVAQRSRVSQH